MKNNNKFGGVAQKIISTVFFLHYTVKQVL